MHCQKLKLKILIHKNLHNLSSSRANENKNSSTVQLLAIITAHKVQHRTVALIFSSLLNLCLVDHMSGNFGQYGSESLICFRSRSSDACCCLSKSQSRLICVLIKLEFFPSSIPSSSSLISQLMIQVYMVILGMKLCRLNRF